MDFKIIKRYFAKFPLSFLPFRMPAPSVLFFVMLFVAVAHTAHCILLFDIKLIFKVKSKIQRAVPTLQTKRHDQKIKPQAILT